MDQITAISLFVLLFALCLPIVSHLLGRRPQILSVAKYVILAVYILANLYETLLFRTAKPQITAKWLPFWSYREALSFNGGPLGALKALLQGGLRGGFAITNSKLFEEIILNILLYVPLGYLLPFTWPRLIRGRKGRYEPWKVVLIGLAASALTEVTQLVFRIGLFEFDDMMNNTLGCLAGCLLYMLIRREKKAGTPKRQPKGTPE